jgi:2-polyprenyl-3-methyl-5-hydroxy-6-metoxy-1,4-benzoquinol methylase
MRISATDAFEHLRHKPHLYQEFFTGDLGEGHPEIASDGYDVVVCEQVLEHLPDLATALATLQRLVRPDGILVIGVPIFTPPLHLARRHLVPRFGHLVGHADSASHLQAFSLASFRRVLRHYPELEVVRVRGFRIVSGGLLRSLENYGWWWRFNRRLGELLPALCIEAQIILVKSPVPG